MFLFATFASPALILQFKYHLKLIRYIYILRVVHDGCISVYVFRENKFLIFGDISAERFLDF